MEWIHCNNCFAQPRDGDGRQFLITNCSHIYCLECRQLPQLKKCRICHAPYNTMPLSKMSDEVGAFFRDPVAGLQRQIKILEFQQNHRSRLMEFNRGQTEKRKALEKENSALKEELKRLKSENMSLRDELRRRQETEYKQKTNHPDSPFSLFLDSPGSSQNIARKRGVADGKVFPSRPDESSNFFVMSSSNSPRDDVRKLIIPQTPKISGPYRNTKSLPITPLSSGSRDFLRSDPLQRAIKLPGDKGGPPSAMRAAFHRLTLSKLSSTPKKESSLSSKYSQYFNK